MLKKYWKIVFLFLVLCLMLLLFSSCKWMKNIFSLDEIVPKYVDVVVRYQRVDDTPDCPRVDFNPEVSKRVFLQGFDLPSFSNQMEQIVEDIFEMKVPQVRVNYPEEKYGGFLRRIGVGDIAFAPDIRSPCQDRAHLIWFNGYLIDKVHKDEDGEYVFVLFDENGVPHEY